MKNKNKKLNKKTKIAEPVFRIGQSVRTPEGRGDIEGFNNINGNKLVICNVEGEYRVFDRKELAEFKIPASEMEYHARLLNALLEHREFSVRMSRYDRDAIDIDEMSGEQAELLEAFYEAIKYELREEGDDDELI